MARPTVELRCVAHAHAAPNERIIEITRLRPFARFRYYVGITPSCRYEVFRANVIPTQLDYGLTYRAIIGPFRTKRGARYMAAYGRGNPHLQHVDDAERFAALET